MRVLLVGFDSAWTPNNSGALAGLILLDTNSFEELGPPQIADYEEAEEIILQWQAEFRPATTLILLDQPTIVTNPRGQRPVENIVGSAVSLRYGGVQPANTSRDDMCGASPPVWQFLKRPLWRVSS
jgi:predicted RNase H-like nuclease